MGRREYVAGVERRSRGAPKGGGTMRAPGLERVRKAEAEGMQKCKG